MYQLTNNSTILRLADSASIPADPANTDYAQYLQWLAEGNTPLPYAEPPTPLPTVVTMVQARLALNQLDLLEPVEIAISALPRAAQIEWEFRATVQRDSGLVQALAVGLQLSEQMLDELFTLAATF